MPNITKTVTYKIPNERFGVDDSEGKTSTMTYTGPSRLILWMDKETHNVMNSWDPKDVPDQPLALDLYEIELDSDTTENTIRMMMLWGGIPITKLYEVDVGPGDQANGRLVDPTDLREVYRDPVADYDGENWRPLRYVNHHKNYKTHDPEDEGEESWNWDLIRQQRNKLLEVSDSTVHAEMPVDLKEKWAKYRQQLRDIPQDWPDVPVDLIRQPKAPNDDEKDELFEDDNQPVIKIADRSAEDKLMLKQFVKGVK